MKNFAIKLSGPAGAGMMQAGETLSKALNRLGFYTLMYPEYPSRIRGGDNSVLVFFSEEKFIAPVEKINLLLAFGRENYEKHLDEGDEGFMGFEAEEIGLNKIAGELGNPLVANSAGLGFIFKVLDFDLKVLEEQIEEEFKEKEGIKDLNIRAVKRGWELGPTSLSESASFVGGKGFKDRKIVNYSGNEALTKGILEAGCEFASIYPMTPINSILTMLSSSKVQMFRPEDEISGIMSTLGASYAGKKTMVATSGGGYSLMIEGVGMAGMAEIPIVIILGQRTGPSTGMATYSSQSDLNFAIYGGHGEFPRIVLTPGDIKESYLLGIKAFELAEKYQLPVILMTDKYLAESRFSGDEGEFSEGDNEYKDNNNYKIYKDYKRYQFSKDNISPRAFPGQTVVMANSYEHDEEGYSSDDQENRIKMMEKRMGKLGDIDEEDKGYELFRGIGDISNIRDVKKKLIVGWGSTKEIILDFLKDNSDFDFLHIYRPFPFPKKVIEILKEYEEIVVIEGNYSGQLSDLIEKNIFKKVKRILKDDGRPFTKSELEFKLLR